MLITGASSGIGRALAVRAARAGYAVYAVGRDRDALAALGAKIEGEAGFVALEATDIAVAAEARALVARTLARFGSIDVLVNNAGFASAGPLTAQGDAEIQRQFGTHVMGPLALVRESLDALSRARGQVFMLGSGVARVPIGGLGAYPPAKAALRSATAILRRELRPLGIAVTYVDPGAVDTPFMRRAGMPGAPANVLVSPEQVARKILVAVGKRPRTLNAVAWQTAVVALAERFPRLTDFLLERAPALVGIAPAEGPAALVAAADAAADAAAVAPTAATAAVPGSPASAAADSGAPDAPQVSEPAPEAVPACAFELALEPHRRRMKKLNFQPAFVRDLLVPGATLDLGEVALRWAGMPNKNERAITEDVLEALAAAGFLEHAADHAYRVVRTP
jgi:short-subunit dehydrogenase